MSILHQVPLVRATTIVPRVEQSADGDLTIEGYVAVWGEVYRAYDRQYGEYDEQFAPTAFNKSLQERTPVMLFNHGRDVTGAVPIGVWESLTPDRRGLLGRGRMFENNLVTPVRDAIAGGGLTGQSVQFVPVANGDEVRHRSGDVPLVIRREVALLEAGPVTMPAYRTTTVGVRSELLAALRELTAAERADLLAIVATSSPTGDEAGALSVTPEISTGRDDTDAVAQVSTQQLEVLALRARLIDRRYVGKE